MKRFLLVVGTIIGLSIVGSVVAAQFTDSKATSNKQAASIAAPSPTVVPTVKHEAEVAPVKPVTSTPNAQSKPQAAPQSQTPKPASPVTSSTPSQPAPAVATPTAAPTSTPPPSNPAPVQQPATPQSTPQPASNPSPTPATPIPVPAGDSTYTNVNGQTIPSPIVSPTVPAGATARCSDGTYSFSQNHRGTCSHHGGVAEWL